MGDRIHILNIVILDNTPTSMLFRTILMAIAEFDREAERQYTWNPDWISTYESPWGIFEKFKYANRLNTKELLNIFDKDDVKNKRIISCSQQNCDIINIERLSSETIIRVLHMDVQAATKWIINKVLAHLAISHFYSWLENALNSDSLELELHSVPFEYQNVPFFLIHLPKNSEGELGFHWWLSDLHQHLNEIYNHLKCPFY